MARHEPVPPHPPHLHKLVASAVRLVEIIAEGRTDFAIKSVAAEVGLSYASAYRILQTLLHVGWIEGQEDKTYRLALGLVELLDPEHRSGYLLRRLQEPLRRLAGSVGLSVKLAVRQGHNQLALFRVDAPGPVVVAQQVGTRLHLAAGATGGALLADQADAAIERILAGAPAAYWRFQAPGDVLTRVRDARKKGYCCGASHEFAELHAVSAPLWDDRRRVLAAVTIMGLASQLPKRRTVELGRELARFVAANRIKL